MPVPHPSTGPLTGPATSRRTTIAGTLAVLVAVAGCDVGDLDPRDDDEQPSAPTAEPPVDADAELVERMHSLILEALATVTAVRDERPDLGRRLRRFVDLHGAHLRALGFEGERVTGSLNEAGAGGLGLLRRAETRLQGQLTNAAVRAESGALAKLLASMAAAVAQHLAVLA